MSQHKNSQCEKLFSQRLRGLRGERKQVEFQRLLGIKSPVTYHNYENGRIPAAGTLSHIANFCDTTVDYLLGRTDDQAPPRAIYGAAAEDALGNQVRESNAAYSVQDADEAKQFIDLATQCAPLIASGRSVKTSAQLLRERLDELVAYGLSVEAKQPSKPD